MSNIINFYKKVLESIGLTYSKDGYIYAGKGDKKVLMLVDNKSLVLPTKEQLASVMEKNEDGDLVVTKIPFNPLNEDVVKGDSASLKKTKYIVQTKLSHSVAAAGALLLLLASDKKLQSKTSTKIDMFFKLVNSVKTQHNSTRGFQVVDDKMIESWGKLYKELFNSDGLIKIALIKGGKLNGVKHNRVGSLMCPLYDALKEATPETPVYGIKLRRKEIELFTKLIEFLIKGIEDEGVINIVSDDRKSPAFIALMKLYLPIINWTNRICKELSYINEEEADSGYIDVKITEEDLEHLDKYTQELYTIPDENDINRDMVRKNKSSIIADVTDDNKLNTGVVISTGNPILDDAARQAPAQPTYQQPVYQQPVQPVYQPPVYQQPVQPVETDPVLAAAQTAVMTGVGIPPVSPYGYQQPMYSQPMYGQQPYGQPYGRPSRAASLMVPAGGFNRGW